MKKAHITWNGLPKTIMEARDNATMKLAQEAVNHPKHYNSHPSGVECIDVIEHYMFNVGNTIKYLWRAGLKSDASLSDLEKELEDCKKAAWYLGRHISNLEKQCHTT